MGLPIIVSLKKIILSGSNASTTISGIMKIKICGNLDEDSSIEVAKYNPDIMGWIFSKKSKRCISIDSAIHQIMQIQSIKPDIQHWAVFAKNSIPEIEEVVSRISQIKTIQVVEDPDYIQNLRIKMDSRVQIIPAIRVASNLTPEKLDEFGDFIFFVADAFVQDEYGGTGKKIAPDFLNEVNRPWFLAGGLTVQNVVETVKRMKIRPIGVDVSSGIELPDSPGKKDPALVCEFIRTTRDAFNDIGM